MSEEGARKTPVSPEPNRSRAEDHNQSTHGNRGNSLGAGFSGGATLVPMMQSTDLRDRDDPAGLGWLHCAYKKVNQRNQAVEMHRSPPQRVHLASYRLVRR